jgi:hypothetical protein
VLGERISEGIPDSSEIQVTCFVNILWLGGVQVGVSRVDPWSWGREDESASAALCAGWILRPRVGATSSELRLRAHRPVAGDYSGCVGYTTSNRSQISGVSSEGAFERDRHSSA